MPNYQLYKKKETIISQNIEIQVLQHGIQLVQINSQRITWKKFQDQGIYYYNLELIN